MQIHINTQSNLDCLVNEQMTGMSKSHKASIIKELTRRAEKKKNEMQKKLQEEDERRLRKEKRAALREEHRLNTLQESLMNNMITVADLQDYVPRMKIYDVRDPNATSDGLILIGGFVGELIMTLNCLFDYILASPQNQNFQFTPELVEQFLTELLGNEENQFPDQIACMYVKEGMEEFNEDTVISPE